MGLKSSWTDTPFFNVKSLSYVVKVIIKVSCYFLTFRDYLLFTQLRVFTQLGAFERQEYTSQLEKTILCKPPCSVRVRENADLKKLHIGTLLTQ